LANRRGERSGELREVEARLMVGAIGLERVCGGGSAVGVSSPGFRAGRRRRSGAWGGGTGKSAKGKEGGVLLVLMRARGEGLGHCVGLATAALRWRPAVASLGAWREMEAPAQGKGGR